MHNNPMFPRTPDSFRQKVEQVVQENMKTSGSIAADEEVNPNNVWELSVMKKKMEEDIMKDVMDVDKDKVQADKHVRRKSGWKRNAVAAAIAIAVVGTGGFTVHAVVENLAKQRLESMPEEEVESLAEDVAIRQEDGDTYSRELTDEEMERKRELSIAYQKGQFPEGELNKVQDESEIDKDALCYVLPTGYMYLPNRALTDEEILQIIDYDEKVNYAVQEQYAEQYPDEVQEREESQEQLRKQIETEGGISEEEAIVKAQEWLKKLYGEDGDGMQLNCYIWSVEEAEELGWECPDGKPFYHIDYTIPGVENYILVIGSKDGSLISTEYTDADFDKVKTSLSDAEGKTQDMYQKAEEYLQNMLGISEDFSEVYCRYRISDDGSGIYMDHANLWFVKEDRSAYMITVKFEDMAFAGYDTTQNYDDYDEYMQQCEAGDYARESIVTKVR